MHMTAFLKEHIKYVTLNKFVLFHLRSHIKNPCFLFPDETLALVFDMLLLLRMKQLQGL